MTTAWLVSSSEVQGLVIERLCVEGFDSRRIEGTVGPGVVIDQLVAEDEDRAASLLRSVGFGATAEGQAW